MRSTILCAVFAPLIAPYGPLDQNLSLLKQGMAPIVVALLVSWFLGLAAVGWSLFTGPLRHAPGDRAGLGLVLEPGEELEVLARRQAGALGRQPINEPEGGCGEADPDAVDDQPAGVVAARGADELWPLVASR